MPTHNPIALVDPDIIRTLFSQALSDLYQLEVPQYGTLLELVRDVNAEVLTRDAVLDRRLRDNDEISRLNLERHGAVRLGTAAELAMIRRLFAVMGMMPVGYYDLSLAGVPVHATAFRPVDQAALRRNPFRVFTSVLRFELIEDDALRCEAKAILARRSIFTPGCIALIEGAERNGGLSEAETRRFIAEAMETFRWHNDAVVSASVYDRLRKVHPLVADIVCFKGPHLNHLTPRTLDIDEVQAQMPRRGIAPKVVVEGPPRRNVPILLRQTSFKALQESIAFRSEDGTMRQDGSHTARFGEIEQRGIALTRKGRVLYDALLAQAREDVHVSADGANAGDYVAALNECFSAFPDDEATLRREGLAWFRFTATGKPGASEGADWEGLIASGHVAAEPMTYEDFLPVSAAGIFQSNLDNDGQINSTARAAKEAFETALGASIQDEDALYAAAERNSVNTTRAALLDRAQSQLRLEPST